MTDKEFEEMWRKAKERDAIDDAAWDALSEDEKKRRREMYKEGFFERISDDVTGDHDTES